MKVGYAKIGRSMPLPPSKFGEVGGDNEPPVLLNKLARRHPEHEFIIIGRNSGEEPLAVGLPDNVKNPWLDWREEAAAKTKEAAGSTPKVVAMLDELTMATWVDLDAVIVWAGQHGTSNTPIPIVGGTELTNPQISFVNYASYVVRGISVWRDRDPVARQEVWLCPDPRNYLKCRDLKWPPPPVVCQFTWQKQEKHYRYDDPCDPQFFNCTWDEHNVWKATHHYEYQELENVGIPSNLPHDVLDWSERKRFGILINEARTGVRDNRRDVLKQWVLPLGPDWIAGKWTPQSQGRLGLVIQPIPWYSVFETLQTIKSTFTTPSSGSGWATTKPWECFATGTICFFHPHYDSQDNILGRPGFEALKQWLRVDTPEMLRHRVDAVDSSRETYEALAQEQRRLYDEATVQQRAITVIEERTGM